MLEFALQQTPMRFGLAEGVDPHQVPFGTLVTAENACWDRSGRIQKRRGISTLIASILGGGSITSASRLVVRGTELALTNGTNLYSYTSSGWIDRGRHPEIGLDWATSVDTVTGVATSDLAVLSNGQAVEAWVSGDPASNAALGTLYYQIRDTTTGTVITSPTLISVSVVYGFRIVSSGNMWVILFATAAGALKCLTSTGLITLQTDALVSAYPGAYYNAIDACVIGTDFVVAYPMAVGNIRLLRYSIATTPVQAATAQIVGEAMYSIAIAGGFNESLYLAWANGSTLRVVTASPSTLVLSSAVATADAAYTGITLAMARESSTSALLLYASPAQAGNTKSISISSMGSRTTGQTNYFLRPVSRPFAIGSRFYCVLVTETLGTSFFGYPLTTSETFLADVTLVAAGTDPYRLVGKIDALVGGAWAWGFVSSPIAVSSTLTTVPVGYQSTISAERGGVRQGVKYVRCTTGASLPADMWRNIQVGPEAYLTAGVLTSYDGSECLGYGWPHGPYVDPPNTAASAVGGSMATGSYLYSVTAERRSGVGVLHRAPVAFFYSVAVTGPTGKVTLGIVAASLGHSTKNPGHFPVYRSTVGGLTPQRIAFEPSYMTLIDSGLGYPATLIDTAADANIGSSTYNLAKRPALYTVGGELEDTQPPSCLTLAAFQSRMWLVLGDGRTVAFSKDANANPGVAPGFYPTNSIQFDRTVTALCAMDDKLIAFAADTFWFVIGEGPAPNGNGATYQVGVVQTDVGCISPRSVVSLPTGLMFQSSRGLHHLSRKLDVTFHGRPIKDQLAAYPNITSAVLVAAKNEVRWTANTTDGTAGIVLVYNYVEDQWSTSKYTVGGVYGAPIADACMWNGVWTFVTPSGTVCTESSTSYLDGTTWVPLTLETAWVAAGGPLAYQAVRNFALEGIANSNHDLAISVGFDNEVAYIQTRAFLAGSSVTSIGPLESCEISIGTRRKCQAIRFRILDATPTSPGTYPVGTGQGPSFDMLGIEVGMMKGFVAKATSKTG